MTLWKSLNVWVGHLVLGLPAVLAVPALIATLAQFGFPDTLTAGGPAVAVACAPEALWMRYTRHRPSTGRGRVAWTLGWLLAVTMLLLSPIWFWSGPLLFVLASEAVRVAVTGTLARVPGTPRRQKVGAVVMSSMSLR